MDILIADKYKAWEGEADARFAQIKSNEEELNRILCRYYGQRSQL